MHCMFFLVLLILPVLGQWGKGIPNAGLEESELFHGADNYDFALLLSGTESQCYWHFARQNGRFYLTYMVQFVSGMIADRHIGVSLFSPDGILLSLNDNSKGQINFQVKETGYYQMCFANYHNRFSDTRVFLNFGVFYEGLVETEKENEMKEKDLNNTLSNIKDTSNKLRIQIQHMWHFYNVARMHRGTDFYLLQSKYTYVNTWSAIQSFVIIISGYLQLFFLKRFFQANSNQPRC
ncbi:transmembrane emp24 domain-containing protein 6-like [Trichomycterus rosablanca]|uniref:transmembrane emp24 domain-containing protein 6-like n=1 Tax=Trichomycterus rosablanca TaxID=2290929 RepID=UPI002F35C60D